jgi:hypothetical protein
MAGNEIDQTPSDLVQEIHEYINKHAKSLESDHNNHATEPNRHVSHFLKRLFRHHSKKNIFNAVAEVALQSNTLEEKKYASQLKMRINSFQYSSTHTHHHHTHRSLNTRKIVGLGIAGLIGITLIAVGIAFTVLTGGTILPILSIVLGTVITAITGCLMACSLLYIDKKVSISPTNSIAASTVNSVADTESVPSSGRSSVASLSEHIILQQSPDGYRINGSLASERTIIPADEWDRHRVSLDLNDESKVKEEAWFDQRRHSAPMVLTTVVSPRLATSPNR